MNLRYVPLLPVQREIQGRPRDHARFRQYLRTMLNADGSGPELTPLLLANPMAKDHVTALLDALLALGADGVAARAAADAAAAVAGEPGDYEAGLVVADDLMGGWTNRYATEHVVRFECGPPPEPPPRWLTRRWVYGALWSSEPATEKGVREAMAAAVYRMAYVQRHGLARTVRDKMAQEGAVLAAGCTGPVLDADDPGTAIRCLFGDPAGATLGLAPLGLTHWAGLALALHDARHGRATELVHGSGRPGVQ